MTAPDREAALERVKQAQAAVGAAMPLMSGRQTTPEERAALQAATEELQAATEALAALGGDPREADLDKAKDDLRRSNGG